jgi:toxin ParE1/3/4
LAQPRSSRPGEHCRVYAADSPTYAGIVVKKVVTQTQTLANFPRAGRKVPEFDDDAIRELIVYSYRIIYRLQEEAVVIAAVIHGKRILQ